jgi:Zn-dependent membrane protease YugP
MIVYFLIIGFFALIGMFVQSRLKSKFHEYGAQPLSSGLSGAEVAQRMLRHYGIYDVQIVAGHGFLSDHYNPMTKTVSLSPEIYQGRSVMAAAVAAHECGHAVQHNVGYSMLQFRSAMVPVVQLATTVQQYLPFLAFGFAGFMNSPIVLLILVLAFGATALFSTVTLPVEFDASHRALVWLDQTGFAKGAEYEGAKDALKWAAMTYVVAALSSIAVFLFFLLRLLASQRDE